ncbi:glucosaminidase domain-containing protein [Caballeronia sordidicola]|uniref:glucosaminidase domain-containing protein n=1 Tax=Caballeronia sordidicola TaxID=196367 RepID=UPI0004D0278C|nr:glucosaminidase domain-containing protein [Caballeronia sordidicola]
MKLALRVVAFNALCELSILLAMAQTPDDVLRSPDICSVRLSLLRQRLNAVRTDEQRTAAAAEAGRWACYAPEPGHPTLVEKRDYIERISRYATDAEAKYHVPAAAIAAMALVEAGYGFTRTAQQAHNLFGWKAPEHGANPHYVLACQDTAGEFGKADDNRCYVIFDSEQQSVDYVAGRLASGFAANYAKADARYQKETIADIPVIVRTQNWIAGIARPYNWQPLTYARNICRMMRDPVNGSDEIDVDHNLYRLSSKEGEQVSVSALPANSRSCNTITVPPK